MLVWSQSFNCFFVCEESGSSISTYLAFIQFFTEEFPGPTSIPFPASDETPWTRWGAASYRVRVCLLRYGQQNSAGSCSVAASHHAKNPAELAWPFLFQLQYILSEYYTALSSGEAIKNTGGQHYPRPEIRTWVMLAYSSTTFHTNELKSTTMRNFYPMPPMPFSYIFELNNG